jgi:hypothetical protein
MSGLRRPAAQNAVPQTVVDYAPDPHGHRLFYALVSRTSGELNGSAPVVAGAQWTGWTKPLQTMRGANGAGRVIAPTSSELSRETTTTDATTASIFRDRMVRGRR